MSDRYHQVGFTIRLSQQLPPGESEWAPRFQTERLQQMTGEISLDRLKLSLCAMTDGQASLPACHDVR